MAIPSTLNPWQEQGIPLDRQYRSWKDIIKEPCYKLDIDAYTRSRILLMDGIEHEVRAFSHDFARRAGNREILALLASTRPVEEQQRTTINCLSPAGQTVLETTIAYQQVAIDLTAYLARNEPDPYVREALHYDLLEDFDHLYRCSELLDYMEGTDPNSIIQGKLEIVPGLPASEHRSDPEVLLRRHYHKSRALPLSTIHILTLLSDEQQTCLYCRSHGDEFAEGRARQLYAEIGEVEKEHVSFYESLFDPSETMLKKMVMHELMEVYNYYHCFEQETDPRIRRIWEEFLHMELTHLQLWGGMLRTYEGVEPEVLFGQTLSVGCRFTDNKQYLRQMLDFQRGMHLDAEGSRAQAFGGACCRLPAYSGPVA